VTCRVPSAACTSAYACSLARPRIASSPLTKAPSSAKQRAQPGVSFESNCERERPHSFLNLQLLYVGCDFLHVSFGLARLPTRSFPYTPKGLPSPRMRSEATPCSTVRSSSSSSPHRARRRRRFGTDPRKCWTRSLSASCRHRSDTTDSLLLRPELRALFARGIDPGGRALVLLLGADAMAPLTTFAEDRHVSAPLPRTESPRCPSPFTNCPGQWPNSGTPSCQPGRGRGEFEWLRPPGEPEFGQAHQGAGTDSGMSCRTKCCSPPDTRRIVTVLVGTRLPGAKPMVPVTPA